MQNATSEVLEALAVTAELTGTSLSDAAKKMLAADLAAYPPRQVLGALERCRRELKPRGLTLSEILARLEDGRPGPEEAWAMIPRDEAQTVVWTEEMVQAWAVARSLLDEGDSVQARMAFLETYRAKVTEARRRGEPVCWTPSLGHDKRGREGPILDAVRLGRIGKERAVTLLPFEAHDTLLQIVGDNVKRLQ